MPTPPTTITKGCTFPVEMLTQDEEQRLFKTCNHRSPSGARDRALLGVLRYAGLRIREATELHLGDYDRANGTLRIRKGKTPSARRVVGVNQVLEAWLEAWLRHRQRLHIRTPWLFVQITAGSVRNTIGSQVTTDAVRKMLKRRGRNANIQRRIHPHQLRHGFAAAAAQIMPLHVLQRGLGHANVATTSRYINHLAPRDVIEAMKAVPDTT